MDKNKFFREATLRICGNLEIDEALFSSFNFLRKVMPLDMILLQFVEEEQGAYRTVAIATKDGGKIIDKSVPLSVEALDELKQYNNDYFKHEKPNHAWLFESGLQEVNIYRRSR